MAAEEWVDYSVKIADTPAKFDDESWVDAPHLICGSFTQGLSPTLTQAELRWEFGTMSRAHRTNPDQAMDYRERLDLQGKYVLVEFTTPAIYETPGDPFSAILYPERAVQWIGYVRDEGKINWATEDGENDSVRYTGGTQQFIAYGLEYFLGRTQVCGTSSREADKSKRPFAYNGGAGDGRDVDAAKRANRNPDAEELGDPFFQLLYSFGFSADAEEWDAYTAVIHLLHEQCPRNQSDDPSPLEFILDNGAEPYLNWFRPTVRVEGRSLLQVLDEIIDRRRGLFWWLACEIIDATLCAVIHVSSYATEALELPDEQELPAAATSVTLDNPDIFPLILPPRITRDGSLDYNRIRVRGARRTATFSAITQLLETEYVFDQDGITARIEPDWSADDQDDYLAGVSLLDPDYATYDDDEKAVRNDKLRQSHRFERVFRYFKISDLDDIQPIIIQSTGSTVGHFEVEGRSVRLQRQTLLKLGYDYADATEPTVVGDQPLDGEEYLMPFALVHLPTATEFAPDTLDTTGTEDDGWRRVADIEVQEEIGTITGEGSGHTRRFKQCSFMVVAGTPGFVLNRDGGNPHLIASADNEAELEPTAFKGEGYSWNGILITATAEWDCYCEAVWPEVPPPDTAPVQELLIQLSDRVRYDYLQKGTVYDIDAFGKVKQVATGGALRDDRNLCLTIAKLAHQWYGVRRAQVQFSFAGIAQPFNIGDLLTTIGTSDAEETVNAVVSQITHDLENGRTTILCGYPEVDFSGLA